MTARDQASPRRRSTDSTENGHAPMFSTAWFKAVTTLGVPAVIALGFSYWVTNQVIANQRVIMSQTAIIAQQIEWMRSEARSHNVAEADFVAELLFSIRRNCIYFARTAGANPMQCVPEKSLDVERLFPPEEETPTPTPKPQRMFDR